MDDDAVQSAHTQGSGQAVNVAVTERLTVVFAIIAALCLVAVILCFYEMSANSAAVTNAISQARADAGYARAKADDAKDESARAMRQADLANWTMMNLEGMMVQHGITVPEKMRPKNLTSKGHDK